MTAEAYGLISAGLFILGLGAVLSRRHAALTLVGIELMWGAGILNFLIVARFRADAPPVTGAMPALFGIGLGAVETAMGLALILVAVRRWKSADLTKWKTGDSK